MSLPQIVVGIDPRNQSSPDRCAPTPPSIQAGAIVLREDQAKRERSIVLIRLANVGFTIGSVFFLLLGLVWMTGKFGPTQPVQGFYPEQEVVSFGSGLEGGRSEVTFTFHNRTDRPIRIVGATPPRCGLWGCMGAFEPLPLLIPAHESRPAKLGVKLGHPGPFHQAISVYSDCVERPRFQLLVTGQVTPKDTRADAVSVHPAGVASEDALNR
ncbi:hypothetical protein BH23PLA1_BH23PLA1_22900 [soil metagenome]